MDVLREIYYIKSVDNSRLVPAIDPRQPRKLFSVMGWVAVVFVLAMYMAWQRLAGVEDGYGLEQIQQHHQALLETNRKLRLEEAFLGDPVRIDRIARSELGMAPLAAHQIVTAGAPAAAATPVVAQARPALSATKNVAAAVPQ